MKDLNVTNHLVAIFLGCSLRPVHERAMEVIPHDLPTECESAIRFMEDEVDGPIEVEFVGDPCAYAAGLSKQWMRARLIGIYGAPQNDNESWAHEIAELNVAMRFLTDGVLKDDEVEGYILLQTKHWRADFPSAGDEWEGVAITALQGWL